MGKESVIVIGIRKVNANRDKRNRSLALRIVGCCRTFDEKTSEKILYNINKASHYNAPQLFEKLTNEIWGFRTRYNKNQYRLLAFWDKRGNKNVLVISTHGFVKKTSKVDKKEIKQAEEIMKIYFDED